MRQAFPCATAETNGPGGLRAILVVAALVAPALLPTTGCASTGGSPAPVLDAPAAQDLPSCNCYFYSDCKKWFGTKTICDRNEGNGGSGGKETKCLFMKPKPDKTNDKKGCDTSNEGKPSTCDGHCIEPKDGSACGNVDPLRLARGIELWTSAFIAPARAGGGKVDAERVAESRELDLSAECSGQLARTALSLVELMWSDVLLHPETPHVEQDHGVPDLSADPCRVGAATVAAEALAAAVREPGTAIELDDRVREVCPQGLPFAEPCRGDGAVECVEELLEDMATFLTASSSAPQTGSASGELGSAVFW